MNGQQATNSTRRFLNFWDGEKVKEYKKFWDPTDEWELPIMCPQLGCGRAYCAFPIKCEMLRTKWNNQQQRYIFDCEQCTHPIVAKKVKVKGDPRNLALSGHWDGFNVSQKHGKRSCWVLSLNILNAGLSSDIPLLPILFIPLISNNRRWLVERMKANITAFTEPFIEAMEQLHVEGKIFLIFFTFFVVCDLDEQKDYLKD
jgi:hypothetical protein